MSNSPFLTRWNQLRLGLCWQSTVLAPALAALVLVESDKSPVGSNLPTAAIDNRGRMFLNPKWCSALSDDQARFVILHEVLHLILRHHERSAGRDLHRWNIAGDLCINDVVPALGNKLTVERPEEGVFRDVHTPWIPANLMVEEIYELLRQNEDKCPKGKKGYVGAGCGVEDPAGKGKGEDEGEDGSGTDGLTDACSVGEWQNIADAVRNAAKQPGIDGGAALAALLSIPPSRVKWQSLLRELAAFAVSRAGRDVVTWNRRNRRSPRQIFLPGTRTNDIRLAVIIDSSGSMSNPELAACVAETRAAIDAAGISAFLVVHDHEVRSETWIRPGSGAGDVATQVKGRGGTLFAGAYRSVETAKVGFAAVIHFTDGYPGDPWPGRPGNCGRAVVALTPEGRTALVPAGWRVVPIEVPGRV